MLSLRIVNVDSYLASPIAGLDPVYSHFRTSVVHQVPVLRIFGITSTGEKGCIHIHGVFPYIYIPINKEIENIDGFMYHLAESLDKNLNNAFNSKYFSHTVFKITPVKGIPFYGYHSKTCDYLKIYFYKPVHIKKASTLLKDSVIMNHCFQPHESHIPYTMQFFIDYNLYGMSFLNVSNCIYRKEGGGEIDASKGLEKITFCKIEADALADNILNVSQMTGTTISNPGLVHIWEEEKERRRNEELSSDPSIQSYENSSQIHRLEDEIEKISQLHCAIKERIALNLRRNKYSKDDSLFLDASFRESHSSCESYSRRNILDSQDLELLNAFTENFNNKEDDQQLDEECIPDGDSILGSQKNPNEVEQTISDDEDADLTLPLHISESENSDNEKDSDAEMTVFSTNMFDCQEVSPAKNMNEKVLTNFDDSVDFLSKLRANQDGINIEKNSPKKSTPKKYSKRSNPSTPQRYKPLDIAVTKSPKLLKASVTENSVNAMNNAISPKSSTFFDKFHLNDTLKKLHHCLNETFEINDGVLNRDDGSSGKETGCSKSLAISNRNQSTGKPSLAKKYLDFDKLDSESINVEYIEGSANNGKKLNNFNKSKGISCNKDSNEILINKMGKAKCYLTLLEPPSRYEVIKKIGTSNTHQKNKNCNLTQKERGTKKSADNNICSKSLEEYRGTFYTGINTSENISNKNILLKTRIIPDRNTSIIIYPLNNSPSRNEAEIWLSKSVKVSSIGENGKTSEDHNFEEPEDGYNVFEFSNSTVIDFNSTQDSSRFNTQEEKVSGDSKLHNKCKNLQDEEESSKPSTLLNKKSNSYAIDSITPESTVLEQQLLESKISSSMHKFITLFAMELHVQTRGNYNPDPEFDQINALFYCITNDIPDDCILEKKLIGVIMIGEESEHFDSSHLKYKITIVPNEVELINKLVEMIRFHDPDILTGYEIEMSSWNYLIERGHFLGMKLYSMICRLRKFSDTLTDLKLQSRENFHLTLPGRIILNVWRLMRHEVALMSYTFENVMYYILHTRVPHYAFKTLSNWWNNSSLDRILTINYYLTRVEGTVKLLEEVDFIGRTSELATLFGIQFYEVLSRGSQFRVESIMLRMAKPKNYIPVSPTIQQRAAMRAPSWIPLIMEPQSRFFEDPVIVLDFQSLYPSMIIAYNYCFSTCLGLQQLLIEGDDITFGCTSLTVDPKELHKLKGNLHISPSGAVFVDSSVRRGILPQMLEEILETRLMVKNSMKRHKKNKILYQILDARQLGLKLIANVTYGYTSANFSGRMPCIEVGDSVVSKGRETLERAIKLVEKTKRWGSEVVYGDTDSMFVLCKGKTRQEAFEIGQEIADSVTLENPKPVKLKLEKVYQPCILQTKKRYVGYMYETPDQEKPEFDAKGIETVRRDGCPAASKILEKSLRILFHTYNVNKVRSYVTNQISKIISGKLNLQDLIFAKEFRGMFGYKPTACVPALKLAKEWYAKDKRSLPRTSERVGYVIVYGAPGLPLIQLVRAPYELLTNNSLKINAEYYITKAILPPLDRCLSLLGVDVFLWYKVLPRKRYLKRQIHSEVGTKKATLSQYFSMDNCVICNEITATSVCAKCQTNNQLVSATLLNKINKYERRHTLLLQICSSCSERTNENDCISLDCPVFYHRTQAATDYQDIPNLRNILNEYFPVE